MPGYRFVLHGSNIQIIKQINEAAIRKLSKPFYDKKNLEGIADIVRGIVIAAIISTDTWKSLAGNSPKGLDAHFGIPKGENADRLRSLLDIWSKEVRVVPHNIKRGRDQNIFSYTFYAIQADWANVLNSSAGRVINDSSNSRLGKTTTVIPWLQWLLIAGDQTKISGYQIAFGNYGKNSRSGKAIMKPQMEWIVPPEFSPFSTDNNFITRALEDLSKEGSILREKLTLILQAIAESAFGSTLGFDILNFDIDSI